MTPTHRELIAELVQALRDVLPWVPAYQGNGAITAREQASDVLAQAEALLASGGETTENKPREMTACFAKITPTCIANRGESGAIEEALDRMRRMYYDCVASSTDNTEWHVKLIRVEKSRPPNPAGNAREGEAK